MTTLRAVRHFGNCIRLATRDSAPADDVTDFGLQGGRPDGVGCFYAKPVLVEDTTTADRRTTNDRAYALIRQINERNRAFYRRR